MLVQWHKTGLVVPCLRELFHDRARLIALKDE